MEDDASRASVLDSLVNKLAWARKSEKDAVERRQELEQAIVILVSGKDEGVTHELTDKWDISVTRKLNRKLNEDEWAKIAPSVPAGLEPVKTKLELDIKKYKAIETANPDLYATVSRAVTITPAKASVAVKSLKEVESGNHKGW